MFLFAPSSFFRRTPSPGHGRFPNIKSDIIVKPVAENIFSPILEQEKKYDIILVGNYNPKVDKGHDFAFKLIPKDYKILCAGIVPRKVRKMYPHVSFTGWLPRNKLPRLYAQSKIAIVCCGMIDSCPRVIPEAIACDCPILVLDRINFNQDKYITDQTGILTNEKYFVEDLTEMIEKYKEFFPNYYYKENLSLKTSANNILRYVARKKYE